MGYDQDFYEKYKAYLSESTVRIAHDYIFRVIALNSDFKNVVDFGCGAFNEFLVHGRPEKYLGVDINIASHDDKRRLIRADYRKVRNLAKLIHPETPTAFVSLFSTEITAPFKENYQFYGRVFREISTVRAGLVSGFYYASKKDQNPIGETGGIQSYQTLEDIKDINSDIFEERRVVMPVPSKMFGEDVFEIWKLFERRYGTAFTFFR